jgi:NADP-dependent 3-hydroxy acid dehydrogenase YdfG
VATAGRVADLSSLTEGHGAAVFPVELDVNDEAADADTGSYAVETLGDLDVVVNNADTTALKTLGARPIHLNSSNHSETTTPRSTSIAGSLTRAHARSKRSAGTWLVRPPHAVLK